MKFAIFCIDKADAADLRTANRPAHLTYLNGEAERVVLAGPTLSDDMLAMSGSLLIMNFPDLDAAQNFAANDPYNKAGLFESVTVRPWKQVLPLPQPDNSSIIPS